MSSVIGVDLGGTKVIVACLRGNQLSESLLEPTDRTASTPLIDQLVAMVNRIRSDDLAAVGIGVPSVVEFETGRVVSSVNIPLTDVPLRQVLGERLGVPVFVDNDATVAALAEAHDSEMRLVAQNLVMITIGTGVGGGIVLGGRIYRGATGGAGELGHTIVGLDLGRLKARTGAGGSVPQPGSLEFEAAGHALDRFAAQAAATEPASELGQLWLRESPCSVRRRSRRHRRGDPVAARIVEIWAERVGIGIANAINTFDPEEVVIGGGAARAGELLLEPARRVALGYVVPGLGRRTSIRLGLARGAGRRPRRGAARRARGRGGGRAGSSERAAGDQERVLLPTKKRAGHDQTSHRVQHLRRTASRGDRR